MTCWAAWLARRIEEDMARRANQRCHTACRYGIDDGDREIRWLLGLSSHFCTAAVAQMTHLITLGVVQRCNEH